MNLNDFFSKPSHVKEAYSNNYPSYTPPAAATDVSSDSDSEPKFNRLNKTGSQPEFNFRTGLASDDETDYETENEPELGTFRMGKPVEPDDAATNAFIAAFQGAGEQNADNSGPLEPGEFRTNDGRIWRFVTDPAAAPAKKEVQWIPSSAADSIASWKANNPGKSAADWGSIPPVGKSASASGLPKMRFDLATRSLVPVDAPPALDLSPKTGNIKSGPNPNINDETRAKAQAWAARKNAVAPVKPVAAPAVVKPAVVPPAALRDIPVEKPSSWKDIAQANNIANPNRIMPGQKLKIPGRADYVVQPGDTLGKIAAGQTKAPKSAPSFGDDQPAVVAKLKSNPNLGTYAPLPRNVLNNLGIGPETTRDAGKLVPLRPGEKEELLTPAIIKKQAYNPTPAEAMARLRATEKEMAARAAAASRKKTNEDDIDEQTVPADIKYSGMNRTMGSAIATNTAQEKNGKSTNSFNTTSMFHDPANPNDNSYMDRSSTTTDGKEENSTRYATNVTPAWMKNLKSTAGITTEPAAQPPSQYPTQVGQGMNNKPFAAYSTPPGQLEINRESLDRMRSLAGIHKK